jgi:hypothetical protein
LAFSDNIAVVYIFGMAYIFAADIRVLRALKVFIWVFLPELLCLILRMLQATIRVQPHRRQALLIFFLRILHVENAIFLEAQIGASKAISTAPAILGKPHVRAILALRGKMRAVAIGQPKRAITAFAFLEV